MDVQPSDRQVFPATLDQSGRLLLPAELRKPIGALPGTGFVWVKDDSGIHLQTFAEALEDIQDYFTSLSPADDIWSEALIAERRREAAHDQDGA